MRRRNLLSLGGSFVACAGGIELFRRSDPTSPPPLPPRTVRLHDRGPGLPATATVEETVHGFSFDPDEVRRQRLQVRTREGTRRHVWFQIRSDGGTTETPVDGVRNGYLRVPVVVANPESNLLSASIRDGKAGTVEVPLAGTAFGAGGDDEFDAEDCSATVAVLAAHGFDVPVPARVAPDLLELDFDRRTDGHPPYPLDRCGSGS